MNKENLYKFIIENNIMPEKRYIIKDGKINCEYTFANSPYDCELILEKAKAEGFNMDYKTLAYETFCLLNVNYTQENEFFID